MSGHFPPRGSGIPGVRETSPAASWAHPEELGASWSWKPGRGMVLLGGWKGRPLGRADDRHLVTVAGTRAGKSSTILVPNLRRYDGSAIVLDPKGELARATAEHRRRMGHKVFVLDPFAATGAPSASHNAFDELGGLRPEQVAADAALMADALIIGNDRDPHWTDAAKNLIKGIALHLTVTRPKEASIALLRTLLHADAERLENLFKEMVRSTAFNGIVANVGTSFLGKLVASEREFQGIISTAQEQTGPLDEIAHITRHSDFRLADLKRGKVTVYLVLPGMRMGTHFRWLRLVIQQAMAAMERTQAPSGAPPVLFLLEEFAALGHMRSIETAASFMAGFGVKLWSVLQDFTQLKTHYPKSWETFLGNAGLIQAFGNSDLTTTEHLSKMLGSTQVTEIQDIRVSASAMQHGDTGRREHLRHVRLLEPNEITMWFARDTNRQLILMPGRPPIYMDRLAREP